jgi:hypothetical protein
MIEWLILMQIICDLVDSILDSETDQPEIHRLLLIPSAKFWNNSVKETVTLCFYSLRASPFTINYSLVIM